MSQMSLLALKEDDKKNQTSAKEISLKINNVKGLDLITCAYKKKIAWCNMLNFINFY